MNKQLLTGLTIVGVAASAGVAYAGVSVIHSASAENVPSTAAPVQPVTRTIVYQVGAAGQVTINVAGDTLVVHGSAATAGWSVVAASATGTHAEVQFSDGVQLVTFSADLVEHDVVVSVTNTQAPGAATTLPAGPIDVVVISDSKTPPPQPAPTPTTSNHGGGNPTPPSTTAPSHGGDDDDDEDDDHEEDEHEDEEDDD